MFHLTLLKIQYSCPIVSVYSPEPVNKQSSCLLVDKLYFWHRNHFDVLNYCCRIIKIYNMHKFNKKLCFFLPILLTVKNYFKMFFYIKHFVISFFLILYKYYVINKCTLTINFTPFDDTILFAGKI
jgi:hypothetical protein